MIGLDCAVSFLYAYPFFGLVLELAPMSPSQLSYLTAIDSPRVMSDGKRSIVPPRPTSELTNHLSPLTAPSVRSPMSIELPSIPLSPIRASAIILGIPPAAAKRSSIWSSDPDLSPSSPIRSSRAAAVPWPLVTDTSLSLTGHPRQHDYEACNTSSDTSESYTFTRA